MNARWIVGGVIGAATAVVLTAFWSELVRYRRIRAM
jgi:predicted outer membrane lipoprotein